MSTLAVAGALLVAATLGLWIGARWLVDAASNLASGAGVSPLVIGLTVVAFGTSAPEATVSVVAALEGRGAVAVGNAVGSNAFNLGVILGVVAVLSPFRVAETTVRRDAVAMGVATLLAALVLADRVVARLEGAVLLAALVAYLGALALEVRREAGNDAPEGDAERAVDGGALGTEAVRLLVGLALVVVAGRVLVETATTLALSVGVSAWLVGVTVVAAGTSLPELVTSVVAVRRGDVGIAAGNVIGSNVFNLLGVLGLAAVVRPLTVGPAAIPGVAWLVAVTAVTTVLLATGRLVTRLEGAALLAITGAYWIGTALA